MEKYTKNENRIGICTLNSCIVNGFKCSANHIYMKNTPRICKYKYSENCEFGDECNENHLDPTECYKIKPSKHICKYRYVKACFRECCDYNHLEPSEKTFEIKISDKILIINEDDYFRLKWGIHNLINKYFGVNFNNYLFTEICYVLRSHFGPNLNVLISNIMQIKHELMERKSVYLVNIDGFLEDVKKHLSYWNIKIPNEIFFDKEQSLKFRKVHMGGEFLKLLGHILFAKKFFHDVDLENCFILEILKYVLYPCMRLEIIHSTMLGTMFYEKNKNYEMWLYTYSLLELL